MTRYNNNGQRQADAIMGGLSAMYEDRKVTQAREDQLARDAQDQQNLESGRTEQVRQYDETRADRHSLAKISQENFEKNFNQATTFHQEGREDAAETRAQNQENWQQSFDLSKTTIALAQTKERTAQELKDMQRQFLASGGNLDVASRILSAPLGQDHTARLSKDAQGQYIVTLSPGGQSVFAKDDQEYVAKMTQMLGNEGFATSLFNARLRHQNQGMWVTDTAGYLRWVTPADSGTVKGTAVKGGKSGGKGSSGDVKLTDLKSLMALYEQDARAGLVAVADGDTGDSLYMDPTGKLVEPGEIALRQAQARDDAELAATIMEATGVSVTKARRTVASLKAAMDQRLAAAETPPAPATQPGPGAPGSMPPSPAGPGAPGSMPSPQPSPGAPVSGPPAAPVRIDAATAQQLMALVQQVRSLHGTNFDEAAIKEMIRAGRIDEATARLQALTRRTDVSGANAISTPIPQ